MPIGCISPTPKELHSDKTRIVDLREGREGFDFLGCRFRARMSGRMLERGVRRYYLPPGQAGRWTEDWFVGLGLHRLRGTIRYTPLTRGIRAALPHTDHLLAGNSIASLEELADLLEKGTRT